MPALPRLRWFLNAGGLAFLHCRDFGAEVQGAGYDAAPQDDFFVSFFFPVLLGVQRAGNGSGCEMSGYLVCTHTVLNEGNFRAPFCRERAKLLKRLSPQLPLQLRHLLRLCLLPPAALVVHLP
jgi:hypothetical protein